MRGECITPRRGLPFIIAVLLLLSLFLNSTSGLGGEGYFKPPYKDYGEDTDGDTKYNFLDFDFSVEINVSGTYFVESTLQNSSGGTIHTPDLLTISGTGTHPLTLKFDGIAIYNSGENGPYTIKLTLYDWGFDICGSHTNETQSYLYMQFQSPPAEFNPPHYDYGLDTNSNTLYDYLVAMINITVNTANTYKIEGTLRDNSGTFWITEDVNQSAFSVGDHSVELRMYGFTIRTSGYDGPYTLELELVKGSSQIIDTAVHMTNSHFHTDFEGKYAYFVPPHSDVGLDLDGDSDFDYLVVTFDIQVNKSGTYRVDGDLLDKTGLIEITSTSNTTILSGGLVQVSLYFLGCDICESGKGTYYWALGRIYLEDGTYVSRGERQTNSYQANDFDCEPPIFFSPPHSDFGLDTNANTLYDYLVANISIDASSSGDFRIEGRLYDSTHTVFITATENTTHMSVGANIVPLWLNGREIYNSSQNGPYNLTLYSYNMGGDQLERVYYDTNGYTYDQFEHEASDLEPPTISDVQAQPDPQEVYGSVNVSAVVTDNDEVWQVHIELTDPDGLGVGNFSMPYHSGTGRYYHARTYSKIGSYSFIISAKDPSNNWNSATGSLSMVDSTPPTIQEPVAFPDPQVVDEFVNITVEVTDNYELLQVLIDVFDPDLLLDFSGAMDYDSSSGKYYRNTTYSKIGTYEYEVAASDTSLNWGQYEGTFRIVAGEEYIPPTISDVTAVPDPQNLGGIVNVSAVVTDNIEVSSVWVEIRNPGGSLIGNYSMSYDSSSGRYFWTSTYSDIGVHTFDVKANDTSDNWNSKSGSFLIATVPDSPIGLTATSGDSYVNIAWGAPISDGGSPITHYRIHRGELPGAEVFLAEIGDVLYYNDTSAINGITYYYKVSAKNVMGEGALSNEASATPMAKPTAPTSLAADPGDSRVNLTWNAPDSNGGSPITTYRIYRSTAPGAEIFLAEIGDVLFYQDTIAVNGVTYYYKISAKNSVGEGPLSNEASATPATKPSAPTGLTAVAGFSHVDLAWNAPNSDGGSSVTEYRVYRGQTSGEEIFLVVTDALSYSDMDVQNEVTYYYKVSAVNDVGESPLSEGTSATPYSPANEPPTCIIISPTRNGKISGTIQISGTALDNDGSIEYVEIRIDNGSWIRVTGAATWMYNWDTTSVSNGEHMIFARSYDGSDHSSEASVKVTVGNQESKEPLFSQLWFLALIAIIVVVLLIAVFIFRRRKSYGSTDDLEEDDLTNSHDKD